MGELAPRMPTVMRGHGFDKVPGIRVQRSVFDRSHAIKTTFDADYLIPILVDEVIPGDTFNCRMAGFARLSTPLKPIMDNMYLDTFFFFVPNRLLWTNWEKFCGAQTNPGDSIAYTVPTVPMPAGGPEVGSIWDYFGIPTDQTNGFNVTALHSRAYNLIWKEWFRDQNLQNSPVVDVDDGPDTQSDYVLRKRGKRHDYFTSCLTSPQKGTAVTLPLGTTAPVVGLGKKTQNFLTAGQAVYDSAGANPTYGFASQINPAIADTDWYVKGSAASSGTPQIYADLSLATAATVNQLIEAFQIQSLLHRDAIGGTRYVELIKSQFGVTNPDFRLQRPEYLGGGSSPVNIHPVPMTAASSGGAAAGQQGNLAAFGTASFSGHGFNKSFTEHGVIIGLASVRGELTYSQGLDRMWSRSTRYDFPWPALMNLGEQAVLNKEIYNDLADGSSSTQRSGVFGYQERYGEYRYKKSMITGIFRPAFPTSLDTWHLSEEHGSQPVYNATFIESNTPVDRVIAVPSEPHFLFDGYLTYTCARPMPVYAVPMVGDRL